MAVNIKEIMDAMESFAPKLLAEKWDNVGLMVGSGEKEVSRVLIALDAADIVIDEAIEKNCQMIITHHPFIFKPIKSITDETAQGRRIIKALKNDISIFSAHTNLDIAHGGTNTTLAELIGLKNTENLCEPVYDNMGLGKAGELEEELSFGELVEKIKEVLCIDKLSVCGDMNKKIKKVALVTGAGGDFEYLERAKAFGAQAYITGDVGYHDAQNAADLGICLIDAGHYATEVIVCAKLAQRLSAQFREKGEVEFIQSSAYAKGLEIV